MLQLETAMQRHDSAISGLREAGSDRNPTAQIAELLQDVGAELKREVQKEIQLCLGTVQEEITQELNAEMQNSSRQTAASLEAQQSEIAKLAQFAARLQSQLDTQKAIRFEKAPDNASEQMLQSLAETRLNVESRVEKAESRIHVLEETLQVKDSPRPLCLTSVRDPAPDPERRSEMPRVNGAVEEETPAEIFRRLFEEECLWIAKEPIMTSEKVDDLRRRGDMIANLGGRVDDQEYEEQAFQALTTLKDPSASNVRSLKWSATMSIPQ
jgi:hypothetical protein